MKTLVIGLGNPILTDDGIGVKVANAVKKRLDQAAAENITVTEACLGGLRLMEMMIGYDRLILIDALTTQGNCRPGQIQRLSLDDLRSISPTQHSSCVHDTSLVTALDLGRTLGYHLPEDIVIYGVGVSNVVDFSEVPTPAVAKAISPLVERVLADLGQSEGYVIGR
jgi:hydrogenase maturation protease